MTIKQKQKISKAKPVKRGIRKLRKTKKAEEDEIIEGLQSSGISATSSCESIEKSIKNGIKILILILQSSPYYNLSFNYQKFLVFLFL